MLAKKVCCLLDKEAARDAIHPSHKLAKKVCYLFDKGAGEAILLPGILAKKACYLLDRAAEEALPLPDMPVKNMIGLSVPPRDRARLIRQTAAVFHS